MSDDILYVDDEIKALEEYGHDCCARVDDRIRECCVRIRKAYEQEFNRMLKTFEVAVSFIKEDRDAVDTGGSVTACGSGDDAAPDGRVADCASSPLAEGVAPITQELRGSMRTFGWYEEDGSLTISTTDFPLTDSKCLTIESKTFERHCDAINAVHNDLERENKELRHDVEMWRDRAEDMRMERDDALKEHHAWAPESHYVMLPKDADGVPIHIGDVMDSKVDYLFDGKPFTVRGLVLCEDGWEVTDGRFGNRYKPDSLRHHREPTVEDVLREFTHAILNQKAEYREQNIAEYATKLRLASDANAK